jgi:hypothetical protein
MTTTESPGTSKVLCPLPVARLDRFGDGSVASWSAAGSARLHRHVTVKVVSAWHSGSPDPWAKTWYSPATEGAAKVGTVMVPSAAGVMPVPTVAPPKPKTSTLMAVQFDQPAPLIVTVAAGAYEGASVVIVGSAGGAGIK